MKRRTIRALLFLLLGAVSTVALAWACAIWTPLASNGESQWHQPLAPNLERQFPKTWSDAPQGIDVGVEECRGIGVTIQTVLVDERTEYLINRADNDHKMHVHRCGWPIPALTCTILADAWAGPWHKRPANTAEWQGGLPVPAWLHPNSSDPNFIAPFNRALPYVPLVAGFAFDSVFLATIAWAALGLFLHWRRQIRRSRGLCPTCAYPIGTQTICPECGSPVTPTPAPAP